MRRLRISAGASAITTRSHGINYSIFFIRYVILNQFSHIYIVASSQAFITRYDDIGNFFDFTLVHENITGASTFLNNTSHTFNHRLKIRATTFGQLTTFSQLG